MLRLIPMLKSAPLMRKSIQDLGANHIHGEFTNWYVRLGEGKIALKGPSKVTLVKTCTYVLRVAVLVFFQSDPLSKLSDSNPPIFTSQDQKVTSDTAWRPALNEEDS